MKEEKGYHSARLALSYMQSQLNYEAQDSEKLTAPTPTVILASASTIPFPVANVPVTVIAEQPGLGDEVDDENEREFGNDE